MSGQIAAEQVKLKDLEQSDPELEKWLRYSISFYLILSVIVGLPIWYFTTTTYRADLPFNVIDELKTSQIEFSISIDLIFFGQKLEKGRLLKFERDVFPHLSKHSSLANGFRVLYKGKARLANEQELNFAEKSNTVSELDQNLSSSDADLNSLKVYFFNPIFIDKFQFTNENRFLNNIYVNEAVFFKSAEPLIQMILNEYLHISELSDVYKSKRSLSTIRKLPSKNQLRQVEFDVDNEITFSLINSKPEEFNVDFNMEESIKNYFTTITNQLSSYTNITIKTQNLLYSDFDQYSISYKKLSNDGYFYLNPSDLSIMTNYIESRLGSQIQQSSTINFVTYVPPRQPLKIINVDQSLNEFNSFLVPRWGGIYIYNHLSEKNQAMNIFLTQYLQLAGINLHESNEARSKLYSTEIFSYLMSKTLENLLNSLNTLESLSSLLEKISNMVIDDNIGRQVYQSVESIQNCLNLIKTGNIIDAFKASKIAFISSEKAFFDPSLLALLYFPEDQKFAIYIPLFIPVGLPLVLSLRTLIKWYKKRKEENKAKAE